MDLSVSSSMEFIQPQTTITLCCTDWSICWGGISGGRASSFCSHRVEILLHWWTLDKQNVYLFGREGFFIWLGTHEGPCKYLSM